MKRMKGSVSVTALLTVSVLLILALALINLTFFIMRNVDRDMERNQGRWFLEGRINEYFDALMNGGKNLQLGKADFEEKLNGKQLKYSFEITRKNDGLYALKATMKWKNSFDLNQTVEFFRFNPFDYAWFINGDQNISLSKRMVFIGDLFVKGSLNITSNTNEPFFYLHYQPSKLNKIEYDTIPPKIHSSLFANNEESWSTFANHSLFPEITNYDASVFFKKSSLLKEVSLPGFDTIWSSFYPNRDSAWTISNYTFFDSTVIVNYLSSQKELIAFGNGFTTRFDFKGKFTENVYIKKTVLNQRFQDIYSLDNAYYYGKNSKSLFYTTNDGVLTLLASEQPVFMEISDEVINNIGNFPLAGAGWSYISSDERLADVYMDNISMTNHLNPNLDVSFNAIKKRIRITSRAFYKNHIFLMGEGNGERTNFSFSSYPGKTMINFIYFINNDRANNISFNRNSISISPPPAEGQSVFALLPPVVFIKKNPPPDVCGIFIDRSEKVAILDFDTMQNYPQDGVIVSFLPLLVRGTPRYPVAVISSENIYLGDINPGNNGEPLMTISRRGVWIYRTKDQVMNNINKCIIYSPLTAINMIQEDANSTNKEPASIQGSLILTFENPKSAMDFGFQAVNIKYFDGIKDYINKKPFSFFPQPFIIKSVKRN